MQCPACHVTLKEDAKFCNKCGHKIPRCPTCGEVIRVRARFCGKDGTPLPQEVLDLLLEGSAPRAERPAPRAERPAPQAPERPAPRAQEKPEPRPAPQREKTATAARGESHETAQPQAVPETRTANACFRCGALCPEGRRLCAACQAERNRQRAAAQQQRQPRSRCVKCGRACADGQSLCPECRARFAETRSGAYARQKDTEKGGNTLTILIVVLSIVLVLLIGLACYVAVSGSDLFSDSQAGQQNDLPDGSGEDRLVFRDIGEENPTDAIVQEAVPVVTAPPETVAPTQAPTEPPTEAPTQAPTEPEVDEDARVLYFLDNCDSRYLTAADLEGFDEEMCRLARNGIYAKSGRKFNDASLQAYYEQYDWYVPRVDPANFTAGMLNEYQNANLNLIMNYEREHGYR